ncbi:N-acetylmuramoyl-L-alanine amidase [Clostridium cellulovorans]|uniref:Cell wall hydrolase/autolysin n=1 Tax=Clostridium cellulovorans (strain ATCC 35296 / DSM 3052 / OCM 3 / 743B) TaxID=573061 RepID=D9SN46_CLOC7|nr:N-acetylmuramoyl-L-alanine amidase [Clostridium cellulovorans]ADL51912.1 cell wall hydrolase/autolysin [Clostridium cellulovorans 743B]
MARLCFDYGHGGIDPGAVYNGRCESDDALSLGTEIANRLRTSGVIVDETRTSDIILSLAQRSEYENRNSYDYFISFHRNAFSPEVAFGAETYIYTNPGQAATEMAEKIQNSMVSVGFKNRGVKTADFYVLRETVAPALLIEVGFIDNSNDNRIFDSKRNELILAITNAILSQLGIKAQSSEVTLENPKTIQPITISKNDQKIYRVVSGSYTNRLNAEKQVQKLKASGFEAVIMVYDN